jgi:hypothetical protein
MLNRVNILHCGYHTVYSTCFNIQTLCIFYAECMWYLRVLCIEIYSVYIPRQY